MVYRRSKKNLKQRGSRVMGYGRISGGHRKSGQRGGVGKAGLTKHHWILTIKNKVFESNKGFVRHGPEFRLKEVKTINIDQINQIASKAVDKISEINVIDFGYQKVLGKGRLNFGLTIKAKSFTEKAESKITEAGGKAVVLE